MIGSMRKHPTPPLSPRRAGKRGLMYLVTGGAIKLTATMEERRHTMEELAKLERVRNYLLDNGVYDLDGFNDYIDNEQGN